MAGGASIAAFALCWLLRRSLTAESVATLFNITFAYAVNGMHFAATAADRCLRSQAALGYYGPSLTVS